MKTFSAMPLLKRTGDALWRRKKWFFWGLLAVGLPLAVPGRRIWSAWRDARARELVSRASGLMDSDHSDAGMSLMWRAYEMAPNDPAVLRTLAKACGLGSEAAIGAVTYWTKLVNSGAATADDQIELAKALLATADATGARKVLAALPAAARRQLNCAELEVALLREEGRDQEADTLLRSVWESRPDDPGCRLNLAKMDALSPFGATRDQAARNLWEIARSNRAEAAEALIVLLGGPQGTIDSVAEIRRIARDNPLIKPADRLRVLGLCATRFPGLAQEIIAEESERFAGKPPVSCVELYEWLARLGDTGRILHDLSEPPSADSSPDPAETRLPTALVFQSRELFLAYGDALILTGQWRLFAGLLQHNDLPVTRIDEELMRAMCSGGLNEPAAEVERHLAAALTFAERERNETALLRVALTAERIGSLEVAVKAASAMPGSTRRARLENRLRVYGLQARLGDVDGMMSTAASILEIRPGLNPYVDDLQYLKLLTGSGMESVLDELQNAPATTPERAPARSVIRALAAYRCGEPEASGELAASIDPAGLPAGLRAVLAGLLAETGDPGKAVKIAEKVPGASLLADERWFLQAALR
jgi:hypothetical protein